MSIKRVMRGPGNLRVTIDGIGDITTLMDIYGRGGRVPFRLGDIEAEAIIMAYSVDTFGGRGPVVISAQVELAVVPPQAGGE